MVLLEMHNLCNKIATKIYIIPITVKLTNQFFFEINELIKIVDKLNSLKTQKCEFN